jgi:hypothetical protein
MTLKEIIDDLNSNEVYQPFFKKYGQNFKEIFINRYSEMKLKCLEKKEKQDDDEEKEEIDWMDTAYAHLRVIQHKKLFDMQCQWRADKITLLDVEITDAFMLWTDDILNCPHIEPINDEEIAWYKEFLLSDGSSIDSSRWFSRQDFDEIKNLLLTEPNKDEYYPQYFDFHNRKTGNDIYLSLPDLAKEREEKWRKMYHAKLRAEDKLHKPEPGSITLEEVNMIHHNMDTTAHAFAHTYENKKVQQALATFNKLVANKQTNQDLEKLELLIYGLWKYDSKEIFDSSLHWKDALKTAHKKHMCKTLIPYLETAYEAYCFKRQTGVKEALPDMYFNYQPMVNTIKKHYDEGIAWNEQHPE